MSKLPMREDPKPLSPRTQAALALAQALVPLLATIGAGLWVVLTYVWQQHDANLKDLQNRVALQEKAITEMTETARVRLIEAQKPFLDRQLQLYFDAVATAGKLVTLEHSDPDWQKAKQRYEQLYWAELSIVESGAVETAMVYFNRVLQGYEPVQLPELRLRAYCLAHAVRDSIKNSWKVQIGGTTAQPSLSPYFSLTAEHPDPKCNDEASTTKRG
jgi:hypothetical protein